MDSNLIEGCIILVDPLHSGQLYLEYAKKKFKKVVAVYTIPKKFMLERHYISPEIHNNYTSLYTTDVGYVKGYFFASHLKPLTIIPCSEPGVELASNLSKSFGLPGNHPTTAEICRNKLLVRKILAENGLKSPMFMGCKNIAEVDSFVLKNDFPIVIKAPYGAGTNLVYITFNHAELIKYFKKIMSTKNLFGKTADYVVLETYLKGQEFALNLFVDKECITVTDVWFYKKAGKRGARFFNSDAISILPDAVSAKVYDYLKNVIKILQIERGTVHAEVMIDENDEAVLIDIGLRIPGAGFPLLTTHMSNFNPYLENIKVFSEPDYVFKAELKYEAHSHVIFCSTDKTGIVSSVGGLAEIQKLPSYFTHYLDIRPGDTVVPTVDVQTTPLTILLQNKNKEQLKKDALRAHQCFKIYVETQQLATIN